MKLLLDLGANFNSMAGYGCSPLELALRNKNTPLEMIRLLLDSGANPNPPANRGNPLIFAMDHHDDAVVHLLLQFGADRIHYDNQSSLPLLVAASSQNKVETVKFLLARRVHPHQSSEELTDTDHSSSVSILTRLIPKNLTWKPFSWKTGASSCLSHVAHDFKSVSEHTQDLLDSIEHVFLNLKSARTMRRQKSQYLSTDEKRWFDSVLGDTDRSLRDLAFLVEPVRVEIQTRAGRVGLLNRGRWVFRDASKIATSLARLNITSQSLDSAMAVLRKKGSMVNSTRIEGTTVDPARPQSLVSNDSIQSLPAYTRT